MILFQILFLFLFRVYQNISTVSCNISYFISIHSFFISFSVLWLSSYLSLKLVFRLLRWCQGDIFVFFVYKTLFSFHPHVFIIILLYIFIFLYIFVFCSICPGSQVVFFCYILSYFHFIIFSYLSKFLSFSIFTIFSQQKKIIETVSFRNAGCRLDLRHDNRSVGNPQLFQYHSRRNTLPPTPYVTVVLKYGNYILVFRTKDLT